MNKKENNKQLSKMIRLKRRIIAISIFFVVIISSYFLINKVKLEATKMQIQFYYSRGSRDNNKVEQDVFKVNDPIQIKINFKDMENGDIVKVALRKKDEEEIKQVIELPVNEGEGSRFVSVASLVREGVGRYEVEISIDKEGKNKILEKKEFEIK